jgi:hypothetical protein
MVNDLRDHKNKLSDNFSKLLQERIDKANPVSNALTREEQTKLTKLEAIAKKLKRGENVQNSHPNMISYISWT